MKVIQRENEAQKSLNAGENLRPHQAADYLGISKSKLAKLRMRQNRHLGPPFSKIAGCVVYRRGDLDAWIEANLVCPE